VLSDKSKNKHFSGKAIDRLLKIMSPRPIIANLLVTAILLASIGLIISFIPNAILASVLIYTIWLPIGATILKSSSRSLLLPIVATIGAASVAYLMDPNKLFLMHHYYFFLTLMVTGIIGLVISAFNID